MLAWTSLPLVCHQSVYITCCSDCTTRTLHMPKPAKPSLFQKEVEVPASSSLDLTVATSSGLILQICLIMTLSMPCKCCRCQVSLAWSMALHRQELYTCTWPQVLYEWWRNVTTGSGSLNFFQGVFTRILTAITKPPPAEFMSQVAEGSSSTTSSLSCPTWPRGYKT